MKNFASINITPEVRRVFERASVISCLFKDEYVRTAYVMTSILCEPNSLINKCLAERGIRTLPEDIVSALLNEKETFASVFGQKAADKLFVEEEASAEAEQTVELPEENKQENLFDAVAQAAVEAMYMLMGNQGVKELEHVNIDILYSDKLEAICEDASARCILAKQNYLDIDNLTYSILQNQNSSGYKLLNGMLEEISSEIELSVEDVIEAIVENGEIHIKVENGEKSLVIPKSLESCCTVINTKFKPGVESEILGRDEEIFQLWNIFSKRIKRNAILLGEAGVGKTAIVEALVQQIVNGTCPKKFKDYTVIELDVGGTVAGTKYRGELEEKLTKLKKFLEKTPNIILFVDEIHQLMGAGGSENSGFDVSGALKPILARGDVVFIGATTIDEYNKYISKDTAFERRFEPVFVKQPKHKEVAAMVKAKVESLENYHGVTLEEGLLDYIIVCASAFNLKGSNPDKTIDLCDRSMSIAQMRNSKVVEIKDVDKVYEKNYKKFYQMPVERRKTTAYHEAGHYVMSRITSLKEEQDVIAVSIVPGEDFLGAYIYDTNEDVVEPTSNYYYDKIKQLLAGRIAQQIFCSSLNDSGACSDLEKAVSIAKKIVTEYSILPIMNYTNVCFEGIKELYNENIKSGLFEKITSVINNESRKTEELLKQDCIRVKVENVANLLLEKKIATAKELEEAFNKE